MQHLGQLISTRWPLVLNALGYSHPMCGRIQYGVEQALCEVDLRSRCRVSHLRSRRGVHGFLVFIAPVHPIELRTQDIALLQVYLQHAVSEALGVPLTALRLVVSVKPSAHQLASVTAPQTLGVPLQEVVRTCIAHQYSTTDLQKLLESTTPSNPPSPWAAYGNHAAGDARQPTASDLASGDYPVLTDTHIPKPSAAWLNIP